MELDLAIAGATSLVGEAILALLEDMDFPIGQLYLLDEGDAVGAPAGFRKRKLMIEDLKTFNFARAAITLFALDAERAAEMLPRITAADCLVVDLSGHSAGNPDVPLLVAAVNPDVLDTLPAGKVIAAADPTVVMLLRAVHPIQQNAGIEQINLTVCQAVSNFGREGVSELASQTAELLNARPVKTRVFPKQIAFNLLPEYDEGNGQGYSAKEGRIQEQTCRILEMPDLPVNPMVITAPVFFGDSLAVQLVTETVAELRDVAGWWRRSLGLKPGKEKRIPTAVTDAAGGDQVGVGRLRKNIHHEKGIDFWMVADNVRVGAAMNSIQIAQILVKKHF